MFWPSNVNSSNNNSQNTSATASATANSTNNQNQAVQLDSNALVSASMRLPGGGWMNASVFKSENHSEDNPVFLVRGTDANGKAFEAEININNVNPRNASFVEMMALDGHFAAKGQPLGATRSAAGAMSGLRGSYDSFSKFDFLPPLREMMEAQRFHGNLNGYTQIKQAIDSLMDFISQK
jgi:hypothetical protein